MRTNEFAILLSNLLKNNISNKIFWHWTWETKTKGITNEKIWIHFHLIIKMKWYGTTVNCVTIPPYNVSYKLRYLTHSIRTKVERAIMRFAIKQNAQIRWWQINCIFYFFLLDATKSVAFSHLPNGLSLTQYTEF